jgi:hypothetical protein
VRLPPPIGVASEPFRPEKSSVPASTLEELRRQQRRGALRMAWGLLAVVVAIFAIYIVQVARATGA